MYIILFLSILGFVSSTINQLSFSGGGSFGAVEIGILKRILEQDSKNYDLYTGISAGSLNAGYLSYFPDLYFGVKNIERVYENLHNLMIYNVFPTTGVSVLTTDPLEHTLTHILENLPKKTSVHTLMGAVNLYSGNLDVFNFEDNDDEGRVSLMMASSAIPIMFPPIEYRGSMYADGGTLSNELIITTTPDSYINVTYITPYEGFIYNNTPIENIKDMIKRTLNIVTSNYNNPIATMEQTCSKPIGELHKYFVDSKSLEGYDMLNFNKGKDLIKIGYENIQHMKYNIC